MILSALAVISINDEFPGPIVNVTTNNNVPVDVINNLDEGLLITWNGIQHRRNSWQDGVLGTNCPIPSGWNWTYQFQVKDQIGSFFYFPSTNFQRASGGYGGIIVNNRAVIAVPFNTPDGDITIMIGDWYNRNHMVAPAELEGQLVSHLEILDAAFIPFPDDKAGEVPIAYVVRPSNSLLTEVEIQKFIAGQVEITQEDDDINMNMEKM